MKKCLRFFLPVCISVFLCGCAQIESYYNLSQPKGVSREYYETLDRWSRSQKVYSEFETRLYVTATLKSPEFRQAYHKEYSRLYALTEKEKERRAGIHADLASDSTEFYFYAYNPEKGNLDFSKADSVWKVFLVDDKGVRVPPLEVREIRKITPLIEEFFPYVKSYGKFYTVKFPYSPALQGLKLVFTSVLGNTILEWNGSSPGAGKAQSSELQTSYLNS